MKQYSVYELNNYIKGRLLSDANLTNILVVGEVSGFTRPNGPGHAYFALKDERAKVQVKMWAAYYRRNRYKLKNGDKVLVYGSIDVYEPFGDYSLIATKIEPLGIGDLAAQFEALKEKLAAEGLFDPAHRQPLPAFPRAIGVITAAAGAAAQDIVRVAKARNPRVKLIFYPAKVQGAGAAEEVASGIEYFNRAANVDLIIFGRGGGSIEDLWEFNRESLVRAVYASKIPTVSAVGHETDFTLVDFAADVRAATPSNAAELAVPDTLELERHLNHLVERLRQAAYKSLDAKQNRLDYLKSSRALVRPAELFAARQRRLADLAERLEHGVNAAIDAKKQRLKSAMERLSLLDPLRFLARGYGIVSRADDGRLVRRPADVRAGDAIKIQLAGGQIAARVTEYMNCT